MMAAWMVYASMVGVLVSASAAVAEYGLRLRQGQARWIWVGALAASLLIPLLGPLRAAAAPLPALALPASVATGLAMTFTPPAAARSFDVVLVVAWIAASSALLLLLLWTQWSLRRSLRRFPETVVNGARVRIGPRWGPAVTWGGDIMMPEWVLALPSGMRDLIVRHEREHQRAGDGEMLGVAALAVVAMPWNPACWWQVRRLREAIELDCDRRLLLSGVDRTAYGAMLLDVVDRGIGYRPELAVALLERSSMLARRIHHMTRRTRHPFRAAAVLAGGLVLGVVACAAPAPTRAGPSVAPQRVAAEPTFLGMSPARYPPLLRDAGIEGAVVVSLAVLPDGSVDPESVRVLSRTNRAFERPAVDAARTARYEAGDRVGPVTVQLTVLFQRAGGS